MLDCNDSDIPHQNYVRQEEGKGKGAEIAASDSPQDPTVYEEQMDLSPEREPAQPVLHSSIWLQSRPC